MCYIVRYILFSPLFYFFVLKNAGHKPQTSFDDIQFKNKNCHKNHIVTEAKEFWSALFNCYLYSKLHSFIPDNIKRTK